MTPVEYTRHDPSGPPNSCRKATVGMMVSERLMVMNHGVSLSSHFGRAACFRGRVARWSVVEEQDHVAKGARREVLEARICGLANALARRQMTLRRGGGDEEGEEREQDEGHLGAIH